MTPLGDDTKKDMQAVTEGAVKAAMGRPSFQRRSSDDPTEHRWRVKASIGFAVFVACAAIALRATHLIGEWMMGVMLFLAGCSVMGESIVNLVKAGKKQRDGDT